MNDLSGTVGWAHRHVGTLDYPRAFFVATSDNSPTLSATDELPGFAGQSPTGTWNSYAYGVNSCGRVVGRAQNASGQYRAFVFFPKTMTLTDLTSLAPSGWLLESAVGISDNSHIVGSGWYNGEFRQWIMFRQSLE